MLKPLPEEMENSPALSASVKVRFMLPPSSDDENDDYESVASSSVEQEDIDAAVCCNVVKSAVTWVCTAVLTGGCLVGTACAILYLY